MATTKYQPLDNDISSDNAKSDCRSSRNWRARTNFVFGLIAAAIMGFVVGTLVSRPILQPAMNMQGTLPPPSGSIYVKMHYIRTFSHRPSERSNAAWDTMFPDGDGFVQDVIISPKVSTLSVFHQLHCLNSLRIGYYFALNNQSGSVTEGENHYHIDPSHIRHCIDYLRQSLVCGADTNVEPVDMKLGGSTGWGSYKTCRDFNAVLKWSNENKAVRLE